MCHCLFTIGNLKYFFKNIWKHFEVWIWYLLIMNICYKLVCFILKWLEYLWHTLCLILKWFERILLFKKKLKALLFETRLNNCIFVQDLEYMQHVFCLLTLNWFEKRIMFAIEEKKCKIYLLKIWNYMTLNKSTVVLSWEGVWFELLQQQNEYFALLSYTFRKIPG